MDNGALASAFDQIAALLELKGDNRFKIQAYARAARAIDHHPEAVERLADDDRLSEVPGVGDAITEKIHELLETGRLRYLDELAAEFPPGLLEMMQVPGVGPKLASRFWKELSVATPAELEAALRDGRVAGMSRLGAKSAVNLLQSLEAQRARTGSGRIPIAEALIVAAELKRALIAATGITQLEAAGSLRRFRETIGDIDLVGAAGDSGRIVAAFVSLPQIASISMNGPQRAAVRLHNGLDVDLRIVPSESFGSLLQHFTGSQQHNILMRERARRMGLSLSEYGVTDLESGRLYPCPVEDQVYARLEMQFVPPEIREGTDEVAQAAARYLPRLVQASDLRGDLHAHTVASDGRSTLEEMVAAARARGYQYLAITDHSAGRGIANGLSIERLRDHLKAIRALNEQLAGEFTVLTGSEVDIRADGMLDYPDDVLAELDVVVASIHSAMGQDEPRMTDRVERALRNPHVDIFGHPTTRLIGSRDPVALDMERVFRVAKATGVALEINGSPSRLDLKDTYIRRAVELGVRLVLDTDSHHTEQLANMVYGAAHARRGWARARDIMNIKPLPDLLKWLRRNG